MVPSSPHRLRMSLLAIPAVGLVVWGCSTNPMGNDSPIDVSRQAGLETAATGNVLSLENGRVREVMSVQDRHTVDLMKIPGVVGVGTGLDENGAVAIKVFSERKLPPGLLKQQLDGVNVVEEVTGRIIAFKGGGGGGGYTAKQTPPIQLGCSGGPAAFAPSRRSPDIP